MAMPINGYQWLSMATSCYQWLPMSVIVVALSDAHRHNRITITDELRG